MPIKPENKGKYPKEWGAVIRPRILARAGSCCEECGVANHAEGARDSLDAWHDKGDIDRMAGDASDIMGLIPFGDAYPRIIRIVLTIAHLDHDPANCADDNLRAWCQRCHNRYDAKHRAETRRATTAQRKGMSI